MARSKGRPTLGQGLDREIYQVVSKLLDDADASAVGPQRLSASSIYDRIRRSNSSLTRRPKRMLEDGIERVLDVMAADAEEGDLSEEAPQGDFRGLDDAPASNGMNKSIVGMWAMQKKAEEPPPLPQPQSKRRPAGGESASKRRKAETRAESAPDHSPPTHVSLADLGGVDSVIEQLEDLIVLPMTRPQVYVLSRVQPPRGILLHGPPGCGKTMLANAFAAELGVPFIPISAPSVVSGMSGESEKALREHFEEAKRAAPCLVFIDEIDAITPKRESAQREMEKRIVAQLLTILDDLALEKTGGKPVIVLAATNRPDALDPALRRGGRFDKEINLNVPGESVREQILRALTRNMNVADELDLKLLANRTAGFVGADLNDLVSTAGAAAIKRYIAMLKSHTSEMMELEDATGQPPATAGTLSPRLVELRRLIRHARETAAAADEPATIAVSNADFFVALPKIQPSSKREGFATVPDTTWADIGALAAVRDELSTAIVSPIRNPAAYAAVGIMAPAGVLLWGPPGCGKTLLAKAVANESGANFIAVKGPELLNKFVGESERAVRTVFVRARSSTPCVVFFDELDALVPRRDGANAAEASARVVNTLLTELDGLGPSRAGIYVVAATNRPDIVDPAMLRPGRLESLLFVGLPSPSERVDILHTIVRRLPLSWSDALADLARACDGFSGADLGALARRAGYEAIRRSGQMRVEDFFVAKEGVRPSVTDMKKYERLRKEWGGV